VPHDDESSAPGNGPAAGVTRLAALVPGVLLCIAVAAVSAGLEAVERRLFAHPYVEALVLAILLGMAVRSFWKPSERWQAGIAFSAKQLLEVAVMLLGASVSFAAIMASGIALLGAIAAVVAVTLAFSFALSRMLGLSTRLSILIACGNSICGNSAIAAVAPVIGAKPEDVASSIAFTAILGVIVVLGLPLLMPLLDLSLTQYGVLAGLTVYAVPQVLAATVPVSMVSTQLGTLVKLVRVLMLGPVVLGLALVMGRLRANSGEASERRWPPLTELVPWFIVGFLAFALARSLGLIPQDLLRPLRTVAAVLTTIAMAALGLGVDVRVVAKAGLRIASAVTLSLVVLGLISLALIRLAGIN
jgi:uncharacterized integral membrane protein (TIGR00698 family)